MKQIPKITIFQHQYLYLLFLLFYVPLLFIGFGADSDTYTALNAWDHFLISGNYVPSRLPGYVVHEIGIYFATKIGDSLASNALSLFFSTLTCIFLLKIFQHYLIPYQTILLVIFNPVFIVNSTSTVDYAWALCFFILGFYLITQKKTLVAFIAFAISSSIRLSYLGLVLVVILFFFVGSFRKNKHVLLIYLIGGFFFLIINFAAYYLPLKFVHWDFSTFFKPSMGEAVLWTPLMRIGRWGYKNILFWGFPSILLILSLIFVKSKSIFKNKSKTDAQLIALSVFLIFVVEILFFFLPIEIEYLLPLLPFTALIIGVLLRNTKRILIILSVFILLNGVFTISLAQPDTPNHASSAKLEFIPRPGYLLDDILNRYAFEKNYWHDRNWWFLERHSD